MRWSRTPSAPPASPVRPRTHSRWSARRPRPAPGTRNRPSRQSASSKALPLRSVRRSGRPTRAGHLLYGYAEHGLETVYVGSSTGLRARHDQPSGRFELTGRSPDGARSGWSGQSTHTFADVDVAAHAADVARRLDWAQRRIDLPAGRYDTLLPPSAVADLMVYLHWSSGALDSADGRTVFSKPGGGTRIGERLSPLPLTLESDPAMAGQEMPSLHGGHGVRPRDVGLRQRVAAVPYPLDRGRRAAVAGRAALRRPADRGAGRAAGRQPAA